MLSDILWWGWKRWRCGGGFDNWLVALKIAAWLVIVRDVDYICRSRCSWTSGRRRSKLKSAFSQRPNLRLEIVYLPRLFPNPMLQLCNLSLRIDESRLRIITLLLYSILLCSQGLVLALYAPEFFLLYTRRNPWLVVHIMR
ncbi:hypothetical protein K438DRAFT_1794977 [Mycena galopus ATCC 62051]|nr:hypothetical protein K438DRAFT_1794977 [Mycena galopus ATCC 62051]